jgi:hypothetical protein
MAVMSQDPAVPAPSAPTAGQALGQLASAPGPDLGILGHIAIHALAGAVRGIQSQGGPREITINRAPAPAPATGPVDQPAAQDPQGQPHATASAPNDQSPNPQGPSQPVDRHTLVKAQIQAHAMRALKLAHDIGQAQRTDPSRLPILQAQAKSTHSPLLARAGVLGLTKIASGVKSYAEASELGLATKLARGQIIPLVNPDGSVDVYELPADAAYVSTAQALEIRKPTNLRADNRVRWTTVGVLPPGAMTQAEALSQLVLPEQRAAIELIRARMENA